MDKKRIYWLTTHVLFTWFTDSAQTRLLDSSRSSVVAKKEHRGEEKETTTRSEEMGIMEKLKIFVVQEPVVAASCLIAGFGTLSHLILNRFRFWFDCKPCCFSIGVEWWISWRIWSDFYNIHWKKIADWLITSFRVGKIGFLMLACFLEPCLDK